MVLGTAAALLAIALGTALGLIPGSSPRSASPFRTFAMVTAVAVVLGQLLPEALGEVGIAALAAFGLGFAAPRVAERLAARFSRPACSHDDAMCTDLGLELGYVGLILHHVGDGIGLGLFTGPLHAGHDHYDVVAALAAHTVPLAALMALAFKTHRGPLSAALRAVGIALSMLVGLLLARTLSPENLARFEPWLTAVVAGLLLHIVAHGWPEERKPTTSTRLMDFAAIGAGLAILALGGHSDAAERHLPDLREAMAHALLDLGLATAPMLLAGLAIAAVLQTQGSRIPARFLRAGGRFSQALRGALIGVPLPVCACGVLPIAHSLRRRGAAAALVVAFLLAAPELGVDTFALTTRFLGWPFACLRLFGALLVALVAAVVLGSSAREIERVHDAEQHRDQHQDHDDDLPFGDRHSAGHGLLGEVTANFDDLLYHVGAWTVVGLIAAAYMQATLGQGALAGIAGPGLDIVVVSFLALPSYVCATSATPLAAVLIAKGISPGAVLCGLLLGPATNVATVAWLRNAFGLRATWLGLGSLLLSTWALAVLANRLLAPIGVPAAGTGPAHDHGIVGYASAALLFLLLGRAVYSNGLRAWLGSLGEALSASHEGHSHGHTHEARQASE
ncbi:MAG: permease [Polyangiales bacterium]